MTEIDKESFRNQRPVQHRNPALSQPLKVPESRAKPKKQELDSSSMVPPTSGGDDRSSWEVIEQCE